MTKKLMLASFGVLASFQMSSSQAALSSSALLAFDTGSVICSSSGGCTGTTGSYFAVDTDQDGLFTPYESIAMSPGSDGGLLVGQAQIAGNSHSGYPDGTEIAPFDAAWTFLGNTGMHQSSTPTYIVSDDGLGNVQLDFSGWGAVWNGISAINLGGDSVNYASETGLATLTCVSDCSQGDRFTLDYAAHVPLNDPSNFGGIYWKIHLEGTVSAVPVPAAIWLFGSGLLGLAGFARARKLG